MNKDLIENNFILVRNFISSDRAELIKKEFEEFEESNVLETDIQAPNSPAVYNFPPFIELLCEKTPQVSQLSGVTVLPTYSYARIYKGAEVLTPHTDRDACEISLTVHLGGDSEWPIFIKKTNGDDVSITLSPGDAMLYLGCIAPHWRNAYTGDKYAQVFLHYVNSRGPRAWSYFDRKR
jgi:hypothetical protein